MRIVVDTNVILSALAKDSSPPGQILQLWQEGVVELLASTDTIAELERVLHYPRVRSWLSYADADVQDVIALFRNKALLITVAGKIPDISPDPKDNIFLAVAEAGSAQYIITGDKKHLLPLIQYQGIQIVTPAEFIAIHQQNQ